MNIHAVNFIVPECSPMVRETRFQSQIKSYKRLKNGT